MSEAGKGGIVKGVVGNLRAIFRREEILVFTQVQITDGVARLADHLKM